MTHPNPREMTPFLLPVGFVDGGERAADFVSVDQREHALDCLTDYADMLYGDIVLVPFTDGEPDWKNTSRDTIEKFSGHWTELKPEDVPRLGVLTDSFARFLADDADDVSVITLWREGTPIIRQIKFISCSVLNLFIFSSSSCASDLFFWFLGLHNRNVLLLGCIWVLICIALFDKEACF